MSAPASRLFEPVGGRSLACFRIAFGGVMSLAMLRFVLKGTAQGKFYRAVWHFSYPGLEWLKPLPRPGMEFLAGALAVLALSLAAGFRPGLSALLFGLGFTWLHLIDQTNYLNHYYLVSLVSLLLAVLPSGAAWSLDNRLAGRPQNTLVPFWSVAILRFQLGCVYTFGGIAKVGHDWLVRSEPVTAWLRENRHLPVLGPLLQLPAAAPAVSWAGLLFDLSIPWLLLARRTRPYAYGLVVVFHLLTHLLFPIGIFPLLMIVLTPVFFEPGWPGRWRKDSAEAPAPPEQPVRCSRFVLAGLGLYAAVQIFVPLRFLLRPGNVLWTEDGIRFSWKVMVAEKTGLAEFTVTDRETGRSKKVAPRAELTPEQVRYMAIDPWMILQYARRIGSRETAATGRLVSVTVDSWAALNGRPAEPFVRPDVDLMEITPDTPLERWLVHLKPLVP